MRYLSLFSGVEAASVAWEPLGWEPLAFCEIEPFPCEVLKARFPGVPNLGDVTEVDWYEFYRRFGSVDVLVGGSPCQSFSIAGNREGLSGESRLMFEYIRAVRELVRASGGRSPRYILWENVPGALSSERGNAFGQLLAELDELGYGLAWRVFDAQFARVPDRSPGGFFGPVAQRRRRVFLVGVLGSPHAAEILFERTSMRGDHPSSREAREAIAADPDEGTTVGRSFGFKYHQGALAKGIGYGEEQSPTLTADYHNPAVITNPHDVLAFKTDHLTQNGRIHDEDGVSFTIDTTKSTAIMFRGDTTPKSSNDLAMTLRVGGEGGSNDAVCIQGSMIGREDANGPRGGDATTEFRSRSTRLTGTPSHSPRTSGARSDWRGFDGDRVGALAANPDFGKGQGASLICLQDGQAHGTILDDGTCSTLNAMHEQPIVCAADDNGKSAIDVDLCGTLKVGGGSPLIAAGKTSSARYAPETTRGSGASTSAGGK